MFMLNIKPVLNLAPSRAEQWLSCPLSAVLSRELRGSYPGCCTGPVVTSSSPKEEEFIEQGVLAHKLAQETINYLFFNGEKTLKTSRTIEQAVQVYINVLQHYVNVNSSNILSFSAERKVSIELDEQTKKAGISCWGTVDAALVTTQSIHVFDLKYGENEPVDARNNAQLMLYAVGLYQAYKPFHPSINCIVLHIIQPRQEYKYSDYQLSDVQLMSWFNNTVLPVCHEIAKLDINRVMSNPSVEICKGTHCSGYLSGRCNRCKQWAFNQMGAGSSGVLPSDKELREEVHLRDFINGFIENSKNSTINELEKGRVIDGLYCEKKMARGMPKDKAGKQAVISRLENIPELANIECFDKSPKPIHYFEQVLGNEKAAKILGDVVELNERKKLKLTK